MSGCKGKTSVSDFEVFMKILVLLIERGSNSLVFDGKRSENLFVHCSSQSAVTKLVSCGISAHYYLAFSLCMTRRFPDAHILLCTLLKNPRYEKGSGGGRKRFEFTDGDDKEEKGKTEADQELSEKVSCSFCVVFF